MMLTCPACHKTCRPRAKFCNHCLQSFAAYTLCEQCNTLSTDAQTCSACGAALRADSANPPPGSNRPNGAPSTNGASAGSASPAAPSRNRSALVVFGVVVAIALASLAYAVLGVFHGDAGAAPELHVTTAAVLPESATAPSPQPEPAPHDQPAVANPSQGSKKETQAKKPATEKPVKQSKTKDTGAPASPPTVEVRTPAPTEPAPSEKTKTVNEQFQERVAKECSGLSWLICREKVRFSVCAGRWSEDPPPGQTICRGASGQSG